MPLAAGLLLSAIAGTAKANGLPGAPRFELPTRGRLGSCDVAVTGAAADIDHMPTPEQPAGSGGLLVNVTLLFDNRAGGELRAAIAGFVRSRSGQDYAVALRDARTGTAWSGAIPAGGTVRSVLFARSIIPVTGQARVVINLTDAFGNSLWLASPLVPIAIAR